MSHLMRIILIGAIIHQTISQSIQSKNSQVERKVFNDAIKKFSQKMMTQISKDNKGNVVFSPLSIHLAVCTMAHGATNGSQTKLELVDFLELPGANPTNEIIILENQYRDLIINYSKNPFNVVTVANRLWTRRKVLKKYLQILKTIYGADIIRLGGRSPEIAINKWIKGKTNGKINKIVNKVDDDVIMMLTNVIDFKDSWIFAFTKLKDPMTFTRADGTKVRTEMIRQTSHQIVTARFTFQKILPRMEMNMVTLRYASDGGRFQMFFVMPDHYKGLEQLMSNLDRKKDAEQIFETIFRAAREADLNTSDRTVTLPVFDIKTDLKVEHYLKKLGVEKAFTPGAEIRNMARNGLFFNAVRHSATMTVTAKGTSAASATGPEINHFSFSFDQPQGITINKPFLFIIKDTVRDTVLFVGKITDPTES